ncbi:MAG: hypothetical protein EA397_16380 [Deltaproteobacteria bacterium]|nr:MAG: hypothetical protein EA397_16380 [Deltaproteobacteria bacterium]
MDPAYVRPILTRYVDPYELVWLSAAARLGLTVRRDPNVYSMTDGQGLLALANREALDPDDTLSQQVLHEICHWLVAGPESFGARDWGYELEVPLDDPREHACLRLQASLADRYGLRKLLAPTGLYRPYYDALPAAPERVDPAQEPEVAQLLPPALARTQQEPWWSALDQALRATAAIRSIVAPFLEDFQSEHEGDTLPCQWGLDGPPKELP